MTASSQARERDHFTTPVGFILACIGSAVGMGNIWLFPYRTAEFGGAAFLIAYIICVVLIGFSGVIEEITLGRTTQHGPIGAFRGACERRGLTPRIGELIGLIPAVASLLVAIGYSVVVGWILCYFVGSFTGAAFPAGLSGEAAVAQAGGYFGALASQFGAVPWHIAAFVLIGAILAAGIAQGIERVNKILMVAFFVLFVALAIYVATLPGAAQGYAFLTQPVWADLLNSKTWIYALGQAFFSLSLAGSGTVVYGSYLKGDEDIIACARNICIFDTIASMIAVMLIVPAVFVFGAELSAGPGLMFVTMPQVFASLPLGQIVMGIFFIAVLFAGITSLINLFESPIEALQDKFGLSRLPAVLIIMVIGAIVGVCIEGIVGEWMDFVSIFMIPVGALCAAVMFFWVLPHDEALKNLKQGSTSAFAFEAFMVYGKYVVCGVIVLICVLGIVFGGIG